MYQYRSHELEQDEEATHDALRLVQGFTAGYLSVGGTDAHPSSEIHLHGLEICDNYDTFTLSSTTPKHTDSTNPSILCNHDIFTNNSDIQKKITNISEEGEGAQDPSLSSLHSFQQDPLPQQPHHHSQICNDTRIHTKSLSNNIIPVLVYITNGYIMEIFSCKGMLLSHNQLNKNDWLLRLLIDNGTVKNVVRFLHSTGEDDIQKTLPKLFPSESSSALWIEAWRECRGFRYNVIVDGLESGNKDSFSSLRALLSAVASGTFE